MKKDWLTQTITWQATGKGERPYQATVDGSTLVIQVNDFPDDPTIYTLLVDGAEAQGFDAWPTTWTRPQRSS